MKIMMIAAIGCLCVGCSTHKICTSPHEPATRLLDQRYDRLERLPIDFMAEAAIADRRFMEIFVRGVESRKSDAEALNEFLSNTRQLIKDDWVDWFDLQDRMRPTDTLYYFTFRDHNYDDYGILVIRDGEVVFRKTLGSGLWHFPRDGVQHNEPPVKQETDRL